MYVKDLKAGDLIISEVFNLKLPTGTILEVVSVPNSRSKLGIETYISWSSYVLVYGPKFPPSTFGVFDSQLDVLVSTGELRADERDKTKELQHSVMWAIIDEKTIKVPGRW